MRLRSAWGVVCLLTTACDEDRSAVPGREALPGAPTAPDAGGGDPLRAGSLRLLLHDAPAVDADEVWVAWDEVAVREVTTGWTTLGADPGSVDLLTLQDGLVTTLALDALADGTYDQIRLQLTDAWVVVDGVRSTLDVPSGMTSGLKIQTRFTIAPCVEVTLSLDWDVGAHLHRTGNGRYQLRPVVVVDDTTVASSCQRELSTAEADVVIYGELDGDGRGTAPVPTPVGDLDGDGLADLLIGMRRDDRPGDWRVHHWRGPLVAGATDNRAAPASFWSAGQGLGHQVVRRAGDLTGDGRPDAILRLGRATDQAFFEGVLYVVPGGTSYAGDVRIDSVAAAELRGRFSASVMGASAGDHDANGDGYDDLLVAAVGDLAGSGDGWMYLVHGPLAGRMAADAAADATFRDTEITFGNFAGIHFGHFDGDGVVDATMGTMTPGYDTNAGSIFTVLGPLTGHTDLPAQADSVLRGPVPSAYFGVSFSVGDLDGDGMDERIVGHLGDATRRGFVEVFRGGNLASGASTPLADLVIEGTAANDFFGYPASAVGDLDGDGCLDLAVLASGAFGTSAAYVFRCPGATGTLHAEDADLQVLPDRGPLWEVQTGDLNGDGIADLALGAGNVDDPARPAEVDHGASYVFFGPL